MGQDSIKKLIRMMKPEIALLLNVVAIAGFILGVSRNSQYWLIVPLLISGTLSSFSASLFNTVIEAKSDKKMKRTSWRQADNSVREIVSLSILLLMVAIVFSIFLINLVTTLWILLGFLSYVILYTVLLKKNTSWNIVIGGISGSFPALAGWSAVNSPISPVSLYLAGLVFLWTPVHFWSFAVKYREDYKNAGIPMLPSIKPLGTVTNYVLINSIILLVYSGIPLFFKSLLGSSILYIIFFAISSMLLMINLARFVWDPDRNAIKLFSASNLFLLMLLIGCMLSRI